MSGCRIDWDETREKSYSMQGFYFAWTVKKSKLNTKQNKKEEEKKQTNKKARTQRKKVGPGNWIG